MLRQLLECFGWRITFILAGLPGVILAPIIFLTVKEPRRGMSDQSGDKTESPASSLSVFDAFKFMWQHRSFRHLSLGVAFFCSNPASQSDTLRHSYDDLTIPVAVCVLLFNVSGPRGTARQVRNVTLRLSCLPKGSIQ